MELEPGFQRCDSDNLPIIDAITTAHYFSSDTIRRAFRAASIARITGESYGDSAVEYVQIKREGKICTLKACITPESEIQQIQYQVTLIYDEDEAIIESIHCDSCKSGGCKHAIIFLSWVHRKSEETPSSSVKCYWKSTYMSNIDNYLTINQLEESSHTGNHPVTDGSFLKAVLEECKKRNIKTQLSKYFDELTSQEKLSIHILYHNFKSMAKTSNDLDVNKFLKYCSDNMDSIVCKDISKETVEKFNSALWHEMCYGRITDSNAYEAAHSEDLNVELEESILEGISSKDPRSTTRRKNLETLVLMDLETKTGIKFEKQGIMLKKKWPVLAATPDRISDDCTLEMKFPVKEYKYKKYFEQDNKLASRYLAQIQMQMYFADKKKGIFCVVHPDFRNSRQIKFVVLEYDETYCKNLFGKCLKFWCNAIYPKIRV